MTTCVSAALASFIRWVQNNNIYEPGTGLAMPSGWSTAVLACIVLFTVALAVLTYRACHRSESPDMRTALRGNTVLYPIAAGALGLIMLVGAVMLIRGRQEFLRDNGLYSVLAVFALCAGLSFPVLAMGTGRNSSGILTCFAAAIPILFFTFWMAVSYRSHSVEPVLWKFSIEILALATAALGFYYLAGYAFGRAKPMPSVFFGQLGAFLCAMALGDARHTGLQLFLFACAVMLLLQSAILLQNLERPTPRPSARR